MHVDRVQVTGVHGPRDRQLGRHTDVHAAQRLAVDRRDRRLPGDLQPERHRVHGTGLELEGAAQLELGELDVLLVLLVPALDLDLGLEPDGQPLDVLVHGPALDPHLALDDSARNDIDLRQYRLDRGPAGPETREQLLERHDSPSTTTTDGIP